MRYKNYSKEDRGHNYFIGEVFAVSKELIPNSQRDYFNENSTRVEFENELRKFFHETLSPVFYGGSKLNSAYKAIDNYEKQVEQFEEKEKSGEFVDREHRVSEIQKIEEAKKLAETKRIEIEKLKEKGNSTIIEVITRIEKERKCEKNASKTTSLPQQSKLYNTQTNKPANRADKLSRRSKAERKLINQIFGIIFRSTDSDTAETIVKRIEDELK